MTVMYRVSCLLYWKDMILTIPGLPFEGADKSLGIGFMPVFDTEEEANKHYPDREVLKIVIPDNEEQDRGTRQWITDSHP